MRALRDAIAAWTDPERATRTHLVAWAVASLIATLYGAVWVVRTARPITSEPPPAAVLDYEPNGVRFGLDAAARKEIFAELAAAEPAARAGGIAGFPGLPWSQEDHRCAFERETARNLAVKRGVPLTVIYLVLDEGIREKWPGADGKPLTPKTVPLLPRRK
jgi:hypothetical protein